jgi:hypothetical protein
MNKDKEKLYIDALNEVAEQSGFSFYNPISLSLLFLNLELTNEDKEQMYIEFHRILNAVEFDDLEIGMFKEAINRISPKSLEFSDVVIVAIVKGFANNMISELLPFVETLD